MSDISNVLGETADVAKMVERAKREALIDLKERLYSPIITLDDIKALKVDSEFEKELIVLLEVKPGTKTLFYKGFFYDGYFQFLEVFSRTSIKPNN